MKDRSFILIAILFLLVIYTSNKVVLMTLDERTNKTNINILQSKIDSLKTSYFELYNYTKDLEAICDSSKTSRDRKEDYHKRMPNYENLFE